MDYSCVIVAAGKGSRMNLGYNKVYYMLDDKCILEHTIKAFKDDSDCKEIIVVCDIDDFKAHIKDDDVILVSGEPPEVIQYIMAYKKLAMNML